MCKNWVAMFKVKVTVTEFGFIQWNHDYLYYYVLNCWVFGDQLNLTVHVHKLECLVKRLLCCIQGQGQEWQQYSPQSPKPYSLPHALCKSKKIFSRCLTLSWMIYHQANSDCKNVSISEDLVETIMALTLNIAKWYFWMILWLKMMHHHTKFDQSEILSGQTFTEVRTFTMTLTLNTAKQPFHKLMKMNCQTKLVAKQSAVENI